MELILGVSPKFRGTFLGVLIIRTIVYWGLYWGCPILENYHIGVIRYIPCRGRGDSRASTLDIKP